MSLRYEFARTNLQAITYVCMYMRRTGIYALSAGVWVSSHLHVGAYEYIDASVVACA